MTEKKVLVPDHIAKEVESQAKKDKSESEVSDAFVSPEDRVLDPTLINKSLIERMPNPTGWRILILPYKGRGVGRYAGARFKLGDDAECRIINDDEVIATIHNPDDIVTL
jgi:hypothetical protein